MLLKINGNTQIAQIQEWFSDLFPYLKIELYNAHNSAYSKTIKAAIPGNVKMGEISRNPTFGEWDINYRCSMGDVEQMFSRNFTVGVQVFRQIANNTYQPVVSKEISLGEQNNLGRKHSQKSTYAHPMNFAGSFPNKLYENYSGRQAID